MGVSVGVGVDVGSGVLVGSAVVDPELVEGVDVGVFVGLESPAGAGVAVGVSDGSDVGVVLGGFCGPNISAFVLTPATSPFGLASAESLGMSILLMEGVLSMDVSTIQIVMISPIAPPAINNILGRVSGSVWSSIKIGSCLGSSSI